MTDTKYMRRALELALLGEGYVSPNPMVGAVIVCDGEVIGEGWHRRHGGAHAEVNAVESVRDFEKLKRSTIYVNLEPCSHWGRTPPCCDMIIDRQIPRVVIGCVDSNPQVAGEGIDRMRKAGIEVVTGVLEAESLELNRRFFTRHSLDRPYIILKWAESADGYLDAVRPANVPPAWMTNQACKALVHRWRAQEDAIMVGRKTAEMDNPSLTVRSWVGRNPIRIVTDRNLLLDPSLALFDMQASTILFTERENCERATEKFASNSRVEIQGLDYSSGDTIRAILDALSCRRVNSLFVEGGSALLNSFIEAGLWDEARIFRAQKMLCQLYPSLRVTQGVKAPLIPGHDKYSYSFEPDLNLTTIRNHGRIL